MRFLIQCCMKFGITTCCYLCQDFQRTPFPPPTTYTHQREYPEPQKMTAGLLMGAPEAFPEPSRALGIKFENHCKREKLIFIKF